MQLHSQLPHLHPGHWLIFKKSSRFWMKCRVLTYFGLWQLKNWVETLLAEVNRFINKKCTHTMSIFSYLARNTGVKAGTVGALHVRGKEEISSALLRKRVPLYRSGKGWTLRSLAPKPGLLSRKLYKNFYQNLIPIKFRSWCRRRDKINKECDLCNRSTPNGSAETLGLEEILLEQIEG